MIDAAKQLESSIKAREYAKQTRQRRLSGVKVCKVCRTEKPLSGFSKHNGRDHCDFCIDNGELLLQKKKLRRQVIARAVRERKKNKREVLCGHDDGWECQHCKKRVLVDTTQTLYIGRRILVVCYHCSNNKDEIAKLYTDRAKLSENEI